MSNPTMINESFEDVNHLLTMLGIKANASRLWNVDETGLCYVVKPNKIVTETANVLCTKVCMRTGLKRTHWLVVFAQMEFGYRHLLFSKERGGMTTFQREAFQTQGHAYHQKVG
ncbi:hypothetical protein PR048_018508 [Dryococelus australis]|uniref:Uncharacterized protein n=1 Tax=Dryococelus australis TaxID=614101 RepID=A0ABQ9HCL7_9NEOP|nr:hypothetical protein PR048_018508 [Dryococelus australis]